MAAASVGFLMAVGLSAARAEEGGELDALKKRLDALEQKQGAAPPAAGGSWTDKVKVGVHVRVRNEGRFNYDRNSDVGDKDDFTLLRGRLSVDARANENVRAYFQVQASRNFGDSCLGGTPTAPCPGNGPFGPGNAALGVTVEDEDVSVHQGFIDLSSGPWTARLGRQEMKFGDERLVGSLEWANRARSFDGFSLIYDTEEFKAQPFFHIVEYRPPAFSGLNNDSFFTGFNSTLKQIGNGVDLYFLAFLDGDGAATSTQDGNLFIYTAGLRTKDMPAEGFGYDLEAAGQAGENDAVKIYAFALHAAGAYGLGGEMSPTVSLEYNVASGEDGVGNDNAFKNLFPTNHNKYGAIDFVTWSNIHHFRGGVSFKPLADLSLFANYHLFLSQEKRGALGLLTAAAAVDKRTYGQELDFYANYVLFKAAKLHGGYSLFLPGDMFPNTADDAVHFAYAQVQVDVP
ncbi:MAG: alginate export family protein [Bdellovibrionota bacterium]